MLAATAAIDVPKLVRRVRRMAEFAADPAHEAVWRGRLAARLTRRAEARPRRSAPPARSQRQRAGAVAPRAHRGQEAALHARAGRRGRRGRDSAAARTLKRARRTRWAACTTCRCSAATSPRSRPSPKVRASCRPRRSRCSPARSTPSAARGTRATWPAAPGCSPVCAAVKATIAPGIAPAAGARPAPLRMTLDAARRRATSDSSRAQAVGGGLAGAGRPQRICPHGCRHSALPDPPRPRGVSRRGVSRRHQTPLNAAGRRPPAARGRRPRGPRRCFATSCSRARSCGRGRRPTRWPRRSRPAPR